MFRFVLIALFLCALLFCNGPSSAQALFLDISPPVTTNTLLPSAWAGGLNSPVINDIDLNGDGIKDIFTFDRINDRLTTFINYGIANQVSYHYEPSYISKFPLMTKWVRALDFDCDGDMDLFTYANQKIAVYRNDYSVSAGLNFTLISNHLTAWFATLYKDISGSDLNVPAFIDADNDGDIDVLIFSSSGGSLEYYKNYFADSSSTSACGGFNLFYQPYCWGDFQMNGSGNFADLNVVCRGNVIEEQTTERSSGRHSGSILIGFDQGCDGDIDLLNGDILGSNLLYLENGGTSSLAHVTSQDTFFPSYNVQVAISDLPSAAYLDLNNDNKKDLIVTPSAGTGEDFYNFWYYENLTDNCSNQFSFFSNRTFVQDMIDVGTGSKPVFADIDNDGLQDIIIGNDQYFNVNPSLSASRLAYFRNTGTASQPAFTLMTYDWMGLSAMVQTSLYPAFGDIDADGDPDLLIGTANGNLIYYQNTASAGAPSNFVFSQSPYQGIPAGNNAAPQLIDVDKDGFIDMLVGNRNGQISYYRNTSTVSTNPSFQLITPFFGAVNVLKPGSSAGSAIPILYDNNSSYELLAGSESGYIYQYSNIDGNLSGAFTLNDTMYQNIYEPRAVSISRTDINADGKFDLITGNTSGGIRLYTQSLTSAVETKNITESSINVYPNPMSQVLNINFMQPFRNKTRHIELADMMGRTLFSSVTSDNDYGISVSGFQPGLYFLRITIADKLFVKKVIKK